MMQLVVLLTFEATLCVNIKSRSSMAQKTHPVEELLPRSKHRSFFFLNILGLLIICELLMRCPMILLLLNKKVSCSTSCSMLNQINLFSGKINVKQTNLVSSVFWVVNSFGNLK